MKVVLQCLLVVGLILGLGVTAQARSASGPCFGSRNYLGPVDTKGGEAAKACFNRAMVQAGKGNHEGAIAEYSKAIELSANYCSAYNYSVYWALTGKSCGERQFAHWQNSLSRWNAGNYVFMRHHM